MLTASVHDLRYFAAILRGVNFHNVTQRPVCNEQHSPHEKACYSYRYKAGNDSKGGRGENDHW